jgi:hypothetical protein
LFGLIVFLLWVCVLCVHKHAFVLSFSHLYLLVCVRLVSSLLLIYSVFCIQVLHLVPVWPIWFICLARIMICNPACTLIIIFITFVLSVGWGSAVVIATVFGLEVQVLNSGGGEFFRSCPDRTWGPLSLPYNGYGVFPEGNKSGESLWTPTELRLKKKYSYKYIYPHSRPLLPVLGWTVP